MLLRQRWHELWVCLLALYVLQSIYDFHWAEVAGWLTFHHGALLCFYCSAVPGIAVVNFDLCVWFQALQLFFILSLLRELNSLRLFSEPFHLISTPILYRSPGSSVKYRLLWFDCAPQAHRGEKSGCDPFKKADFSLSPDGWIQPHILTFVKRQLPRWWRARFYGHNVKLERKILTRKRFQIMGNVCPAGLGSQNQPGQGSRGKVNFLRAAQGGNVGSDEKELLAHEL